MQSRHWLPVCLIAVLIAAAAPAQQAPVRKRQNFQCLSPDQVKLYAHAIDVLAKRDPKNDNPKDPLHNSYAWYASLHNGSPRASTCNHMNELFLPWHRALLRIFEQALQESDPGNGTRDIMLPYWNWTALPTGKHYPKPFEEDPALSFARSNDQPERIRYAESLIRAAIVDSKTWEEFGGASCDDNPKCTDVFGGGAIEDPYHNRMHGWIGGAMIIDTSAAKDPLFWSFDAYIDAIFDTWQREKKYPPLGCRKCDMRALPGWTPERVERTESLDYQYDMAICGKPGAPRAAPAFDFAERKTDLGKPKGTAAAGLIAFGVTIPDGGFESAEIDIAGAEVPSDFNYSGSVFLYPAGTEFDTKSEAFRKRYFVGEFAVWALHHDDLEHGHAAPKAHLYVDATPELRYLAKKQPRSQWMVAVVVDTVQPTSDEARAAGTRALRSRIRFDDVSLEIDRGTKEVQP